MPEIRHVGIDPATNTGFVALDPYGNLLRAKEITGIKADTARMIRTLHDEVYRHLQAEDVVAIEWFALETYDTNKVSSGCNWAARLAADRVVGSFVSPTTNQLKKFVGVSEWTGEKGEKKRLDGKAVKKLVIQAVLEHWGFETKSDNIADAYVLARIAKALYEVRNGISSLADYPIYQQEVLTAIINPPSKDKAKPKKPKSKTTQRRGKASAGASYTQNTVQGVLF